MVRQLSLSLGAARLYRELTPDDDLILLDFSDIPRTRDKNIFTEEVEDVDSDSSSEVSSMESTTKLRVKSSKKRLITSDYPNNEGCTRDIDFKVAPDNRGSSSLVRSQSTRAEMTKSPVKPRSNSGRKGKDYEFPVTRKLNDSSTSANQDDPQASKNMTPLFGGAGKTQKGEGKGKQGKTKDDSPWGEFEHYIRNIDLDTMHFQPKPFTNTSSGQFKEVMTELQTEHTRVQTRRSNLKNSLKMSIKFHGFKKNMADLKEAVHKQEEIDAKKKIKQTKKARPGPKSRGWKILRAHLQEMHLDKQKNKKMGGWNLLTKTMKNLTDQEKARQDLYDKYLHKPNAWMDGFSTLPQLLQDRMKMRADNPTYYKPRQRPHTAVGVMGSTWSESTVNFPQVKHVKKRRKSRSAVISRQPLSAVGC